jgi:hypothetical protein
MISLMQEQETSLSPPHPNPLPLGEREVHRFPPPLIGSTSSLQVGGGEREGDCVS